MPYNLDDNEVAHFQDLVMEEKWEKVIENYQENSNYQNIIIKRRGTALHAAISHGRKEVVNMLLDAIIKRYNECSLRITNERGDTPLHIAAYKGFAYVCELIIGKEGERKYLTQEKNANGETPLFCAVVARQISVFVYLRQFYTHHDLNIAIDKDNTSILHVAISKEMFDWASMIMYYYEGLIPIKDKDGNIPLEILATKTSAFPSGCRLSLWKQIVYYCIPESLYDEKNAVEVHLKNVISKEKAKNGLLPMNIAEKDEYSEVAIHLHHNEAFENTDKRRLSITQLCLCILKNVIWPIVSLLDLHATKTIMKKHLYAYRILEEFMKHPNPSYPGGGDAPIGDIEDDFLNLPEFIKRAPEEGNASMQETKEYKEIEDLENIDVKDTTFFAAKKISREEIMEELNSKVPITFDKKGLLLVAMKNNKTKSSEEESPAKNTAYLIAASFGIVEMMRILESKWRSVTHETNINNENALLLAVKNRKPHVVRWLRQILTKEDFDILSLQVNKNEDTMLHLAAGRKSTWKISGAVMQMTLEIKWYEYIKNLVPEHFNILGNEKGKIPSEIFEEQHTELLKENVEWLKNTTESYSVVAALIAGVAFATSGSVPGGNQPTGEPALKGQHGFEVFAITSLIGLYFSVTALIMFLSILTSRKEVEQFRINLPMKLLFGLSSLFVSIVAMFVSFCAGHFFVLTDKYTNGSVLFYLYISICLPVIFFAAVQFHLIVDLFKISIINSPPSTVKSFLQ